MGLRAELPMSLFRGHLFCFPCLLLEAWGIRSGCGPVSPGLAVLNLFVTFPLGPGRAASAARDEGLRPGHRASCRCPQLSEGWLAAFYQSRW